MRSRSPNLNPQLSAFICANLCPSVACIFCSLCRSEFSPSLRVSYFFFPESSLVHVTKLGLCNEDLLQLIDLRRQDKIVLAQPADRVGPDLDPEILVAPKMQIGVMLFGFGEFRDLLKEAHPGEKILHRPILANPLAVIGELPAVKLFELLLGFLAFVLGNAPFAGDAFFSGQFRSGQSTDGHDGRWGLGAGRW